MRPPASTRSAAGATRPTLLVALFGALVLLAAGLHASDASHAAAEPGERYANGLLWRVEAPWAAPSYLFGTLHLRNEEAIPIPPRVARELAAARVLATEIPLAAADQRRIAAGLRDPSRALRKVLGEEAFESLHRELAGGGWSAEQLESLTPFAALATMSVARSPHGASLDQRLYDEGRRRGLALVALESVDDQLAAFREVDGKAVLYELRHALAHPDAFSAGLAGLLADYRAEAIGRIADGVARSLAPGCGACIAETLIYPRTRAMLERIDPIVREGRAVIAVGASHLGGERGVLATLAARGFTVTRVPLD